MQQLFVYEGLEVIDVLLGICGHLGMEMTNICKEQSFYIRSYVVRYRLSLTVVQQILEYLDELARTSGDDSHEIF